jgi:hypothetical protein
MSLRDVGRAAERGQHDPDPAGDTIFNFNAPFQDFVRGQMTMTGSEDFGCSWKW